MTLLNPKQLTWPQRKQASHKGHHGSVAIIGGAEGMYGAALLAARAAMLAGAGRSYLASLQTHSPVTDMRYPELMMRSVDSLFELKQLDCIGIGPGLGLSALAQQVLQRALTSTIALVVDADALNLLAQDSGLQALMAQRTAAKVITPHEAEAARLLGVSTEDVASNRTATAQQLAQQYDCVCVLKGQHSQIAHPQGECVSNPTGNVGLASGGTGDVLTGIIASLMAQGLSAWEAAKTGTYIHGLAADQLVAKGIGPIGLRASEVSLQVRDILNHHD